MSISKIYNLQAILGTSIGKHKLKVQQLEEVVTELKKKVVNDIKMKSCSKIKPNHEKANINSPALRNRHVLKCNLCDAQFNKISDLENHIKREHQLHDTYECDQCKKMCVTKWRLEKHKRIHSGINLKQCHYFRNKQHCPFDELGCKFRHLDIVKDTPKQMGDNSEMLSEHSSDTLNHLEHYEDISDNRPFCTFTPKVSESLESIHTQEVQYSSFALENGYGMATSSFLTSTPKKCWNRCEECFSKSEYADCDDCLDKLVKHMNRGHGNSRDKSL